MARQLNPKQKLFAKEFIVDLNATHAAIRAGYSEKTAKQIGSKLLTKVDLRAYVAELMDERSKRTMVDADYVVRHLIEVNGRCLQKVPVMVFDPIDKRMVQEQDENGNDVWQFDSNGANRSLELLGRHLAMFTEKTRVTTVHEQPLF